MQKMITTDQIKQWSHQLGFTLTGIAPAEPVETADSLRRYLEKQHHGQMTYLARNVDKRIDPQKLVPGAKSIICTATNYFTESPCPPETPYKKIARYARFQDYHDILKARLKKLTALIRQATGDETTCRCFVDTAPLAEKYHAARAGLGWIGKNSLLLNETYGSWLLLGEIVTNLNLQPDNPVPEKCGTCQKCIDACPTTAIIKPYTLEARRCISYLTTESQTEIPKELENKIGPRFFGCDTCQEVCPVNQQTPPTTDPAFQPNPQGSYITHKDLKALDPGPFKTRFKNTPLSRINLNQIRIKKPPRS
ncbi:MAG: tRNA epoxyqueuosine(34) reductase QueG [Phycisphaerae bacterium]|nr:tRNA epoxyqueuosine(34) reductase QueG [Phycisphaerae bacterium]